MSLKRAAYVGLISLGLLLSNGANSSTNNEKENKGLEQKVVSHEKNDKKQDIKAEKKQKEDIRVGGAYARKGQIKQEPYQQPQKPVNESTYHSGRRQEPNKPIFVFPERRPVGKVFISPEKRQIDNRADEDQYMRRQVDNREQYNAGQVRAERERQERERRDNLNRRDDRRDDRVRDNRHTFRFVYRPNRECDHTIIIRERERHRHRPRVEIRYIPYFIPQPWIIRELSIKEVIANPFYFDYGSMNLNMDIGRNDSGKINVLYDDKSRNYNSVDDLWIEHQTFEPPVWNFMDSRNPIFSRNNYYKSNDSALLEDRVTIHLRNGETITLDIYNKN